MAGELRAISDTFCAYNVVPGSSVSLSLVLALLWFYPLPLSFSLLLFVSCLAFLSPLDVAHSSSVNNVSVSGCSTDDLLASLSRGALAGVTLAGPALGLRLAVDYISRLVFPDSQGLRENRGSYQLAYLLLGIMVLIDFLPATLGILENQALNVDKLMELGYLVETLSGAFRLGLIISTPVLILGLTLGIIQIVLERLSPQLINAQLVSGLALPILLLFGSQSLYTLGRESLELGLSFAIENLVEQAGVNPQPPSANPGGN